MASQVVWDTEPVTITANQALAAEAAGTDKRGAEEDAEEFLRDILADGPVAQKEIKDAVEGNGLAWATVRRAKGRIGVKAERQSEGKTGAGGWCLVPPSYAPKPSYEGPNEAEGLQGAHQTARCSPLKHEHLAENEHLAEPAAKGIPIEDPQECMAPDPTEAPSPPVPDRTCRQCNGALDGTERPYSVNGSQVWLHPECRRFFGGRVTTNPAEELIKTIYGDSLKSPPDGGKVRLPDAQSKPWQAFGISRATWYRQGKPQCESQFSGKYYRRQKSQAESLDCSERTVQRLAFARRYGIPEIDSLAIQMDLLPPAMLEEIAKWEHEDQRRFTDRLATLAADLPKAFELTVYRDWSPFELAVWPVKNVELRRAARRAFDATLREIIADTKAELEKSSQGKQED